MKKLILLFALVAIMVSCNSPKTETTEIVNDSLVIDSTAIVAPVDSVEVDSTVVETPAVEVK